MHVQHVPDGPLPARVPEVVATIGKFDGIHRGHRALLQRVVAGAAAMGMQSAVVTFEPHPALVLRPDTPLRLLSTLEDRLAAFEHIGVDHVLVWRFDAETQRTTAEGFMEQLNRRVRVRRLVHGPGFALGYRRQGTPLVLAEIGQRLGFELQELAPLGSAQPGPAARVTSTGIRGLVQAGEVREATAALGHQPTLTGVVEQGEQVGRTIGFPTANLRIDAPHAVPADGVYAAWAEIAPFTSGARRVPSAVSIGTRPTFEGTRRVVEAYLLDFNGDLYGRTLRLHFVERLRGQEKFDGIEPLVSQMNRDVTRTRQILMGRVWRAATDELAAAEG